MICIDESGNLGSGGRYFVISAIESENPKRLKNIAKRFCADLGVDEIKGTLLRFPQRQGLINKLSSKDDYDISYLVFDKNNFRRTDMLGRNVLFNYLVSFVCESIFNEASGILFCVLIIEQ